MRVSKIRVIITYKSEYSLINLSFPILKLIKITYKHSLIRYLIIYIRVSFKSFQGAFKIFLKYLNLKRGGYLLKGLILKSF